ncbi:hypothetical protein [Gemmatimonas aurantiaca]|uniref:hypothetical protein n=1 Tax=Gemmatimonas aurantiaca TaxID=173480 RepID=UPI00301E2D70
MRVFRQHAALLVLGLLMFWWPLHGFAQTTYEMEGSVLAVWGLPLDRPTATPGVLLRVGVVQQEALKRISGRLALEGIGHARSMGNASDQDRVKALIGLGYDLRFHGSQRPVRHFMLMGAGLYASPMTRGDGYPALLLSPRIGWGGEVHRGRMEVGLEISAQYARWTNLGMTEERMVPWIFPVGITVRY